MNDDAGQIERQRTGDMAVKISITVFGIRIVRSGMPNGPNIYIFLEESVHVFGSGGGVAALFQIFRAVPHDGPRYENLIVS